MGVFSIWYKKMMYKTEQSPIFVTLPVSLLIDKTLGVLYGIHYKNTPIQIYWKFYHRKMKVYR